MCGEMCVCTPACEIGNQQAGDLNLCVGVAWGGEGKGCGGRRLL